MVTARGEVKRTKMEEYANLRANGLITFDLEPNDRLGWVKHTDGTMKIILTSVKGMAIQFHEEDVPSRGRAAGGVRGMTLDGPDDCIVTADLVPEKSELLVVSRHGYGKRTPMSEYRSAIARRQGHQDDGHHGQDWPSGAGLRSGIQPYQEICALSSSPSRASASA